MERYSREVKKIVDTYEYALEQWDKARRKSIESYKYLFNDQWTEEEKHYLKADGRPAMVYNLLIPRINNLIGTEQLNRRSVKIRPRTQKDKQMASIINALFKTIFSNEDVEYELQRAFIDGLVMTIPGFVEILIETDIDGLPSYKFGAANSFNILPDPSYRDYGMRDARYVIKEKWMSLDEIVEMYGHKDSYYSEEKREWWEELSTAIGNVLGKSEYDSRYYDKNNDKYKVLEMQERVFVKETVLYNTVEDKYIRVPKDKAKEEMNANKDLIFVTEDSKKRIFITTCVPHFDEIVYKDFDKYKATMFNVIPYCSFDVNHKKSENNSLVEALKDVQKNYNKRQAQITNHIDHDINAPIFFSDNDIETKEEYQRNGNKPRAAFTLSNMNHKPFVKSPSMLSPDAWRSLADAERVMNDISSVNEAMRGNTESASESGRLFQMKTERAGVSVNPYFSNLSKTRKLIAEYMFDTLKEVYGQRDRLIAITDPKTETEEEAILNLDMYGKIHNNVNDFEGRVMIDEGEYSPTKLADDLQTKLMIFEILGRDPSLVDWEWMLRDSELNDVDVQIEHIQNVLNQNQQQQAEESAMQNKERVLENLKREREIEMEGQQ